MVSSPQTPIRATWSSLQCLSNLSPPSPTLSPSRLSTAITSGEIPIFLDSGIPTTPASPGSPSYSRRRYRTNTTNSLDLLTSLLGLDEEMDAEDISLTSSHETTNTFGPSRRLWSLPSEEISQSSTPPGQSMDNRPTYRRHSTVKPCDSTAAASHSLKSKTSTSTFGKRLSSASTSWAKRPPSQMLTPLPCHDTFNPRVDDEDTISISYALQGSESYHSVSTYYTAASVSASNSDHSFLSLEVGPGERNSVVSVLSIEHPEQQAKSETTPTKTLPSPSPSTYSLNSISFAQPSPTISVSSDFFPPPARPSRAGRLARRNGLRQPSQSHNSDPRHQRQPTQASISGPDVGAIPIIIPNNSQVNRLRSGSTSTMKSAHSFQSTQSNLSTSSSTQSWFANSDSLAAMPTHHTWLKDVTVELMIDQEGFRAIAPAFKLVGFTDVGGGIAHFLPAKRKSQYIFHHAMLDADPVLYRIQVNGEEKRDYLSRQANLSLKIPGVYTVSGTEVLRGGSRSINPSSEPENFLSLADATITPFPSSKSDTRLEWIFTYCVEPRINARGVVVDGERTLRPMSFACSPMLLHASQARKVGLLRLAAKFVQPKLAAQRVAPPAAPQGRVPLAAVENVPRDVAPSSFGWNDKHVRGVSHTSEDSKMEDEARPLIKRVSKQQSMPFVEQRRQTLSQPFIDLPQAPIGMHIIPDGQRIFAPGVSSNSLSAFSSVPKISTPVFNNFFEDLNAFRFGNHRRMGSQQSNTSVQLR